MANVFGIETLKSKIGGFAKGNRYNVTFADLPTGLSTDCKREFTIFV